MLAIADEYGPRPERLRRAGGVEVQLDHLPVTFVLVVEVVEDVEEPVLKRQLARMAGIRLDPRVRHRPSAAVQAVRPAIVGTPGSKRVAGEVQVVAPEPPPEVGSGRRDLDDVRA